MRSTCDFVVTTNSEKSKEVIVGGNTRTFCEFCRDFVDYHIEERSLEGQIKDKLYRYNGKVAICDECGSEIYVGELNDYNLQKLYDIYRKENDIISLDKILEISKMYNIGKRPLSTLLGWGEQTFSRYCDGDIPTKQFSDVLNKIYSEPEFFLKILDENKDKVTDVTFIKAKNNALNLIKNKFKANKKIEYIANYLIEKLLDITPFALQKLLYYSQGFFVALYGIYLFDDDCEAWVHGPVYKYIYNKYRNFHYNPIPKEYKVDESLFSDAEIDVISNVAKYAGCYSGKILEDFTHKERPWLNARNKLEPFEHSNEIISKKEMELYFKVVNKYEINNPEEIEFYFEGMFKNRN